jgi:Reverse transcriptase (RNA-dependent DNA polymerase).
LESKIEKDIEEDQFGFRKGTRDAIGLMRMRSERLLDVKEEMCLCFIVWQKAFDRVDWNKMLGILRNIGVKSRERRLICKLYM